jgi:hypothetical protein
MNVHQKPVVMSGVRQGACARCGSRVYKASTLQMLEDAMRARTGPPLPAIPR